MPEAWPGVSEPKKKERRGYSSLDAIDPRDGKIWQILLPDSKMDWVASQGRGATLELADTVRWALLHPRHLFRGIRDIDRDISEDNWLCYVALPGHAYDYRTHQKRAAWTNEVFLVFVTDERMVYQWYWDACDPQDRSLPEDWEDRFREELI